MSELVNVTILFETEMLWKYGLAMETMRRESAEKFEESMVMLRYFIKRRTPVAFGGLRRSIDYEIEKVERNEFMGIVRSVEGNEGALTPWKYAWMVEEGTVPHWPPYEPIMRWVEGVLYPPWQEVNEITFMVSRHIARHGTPASHMFRDGEQDFEASNILETNMKEAADAAMKILTAPKPWWMF